MTRSPYERRQTEMLITLWDEELIPLTAAAKEFPGNVHVASIHRWCSKGVRGHVLETVVSGGRRYTSKEAIRRFLAAQNSGTRNPGGGGFSSPDRKNDARVERELRRLGL